MSKDRIDVLFVCAHNAGRSVAAKTIFNDRSAKLGLEIRAESTGTVPGERINPTVQRILATFKLDASREIPKLINNEMLQGGPRIITMECEVDTDSCTAINLAEVDDWGLPDPSKMSSDDEIVTLIHDIARRVNTLIQEMTSDR